MAHVPAAPRVGRSYDGDRREVLAELARIDREKPPLNPGSVQSTDGSVIRIPGPLADTGRHGQVLTYDEDLHQPVWTPSTGGVTGVTRLTAGSMTQTNAAAPVGSAVTFTDFTIAPLWGEALAITVESDGHLILPAGAYQAHAYVRLAFDGSAAVDEVRLSADFDGADPYPLRYALLGTSDGHGGGPALRDDLAWGPFYVDAGGWTVFNVNWMTADVAYLSAMAIDVWQVG